jgi:hypothetical protein
MFDPTSARVTPPQDGHGNRVTCAHCGRLISPRRHAHRQKFCGATCREYARKSKNFAATGHTRGLPRSTRNTPANSMACEGQNRGPRSSVNGVLAAVGRGLGNVEVVPTTDGLRRQLIKNAIAAELSARWPTGGLRR